MREERQNDIFEPIDIDLTLLNGKEAFFGIFGNLLSRLKVLRCVNIHIFDHNVLLA